MNDGSPLYIAAGKEKLHYLKWGSGPLLLLAFHGYGNNALIFQPFREYLSAAYTMLSFDLPFHGASNWPDDTLLAKTDLTEMVQKLMARYNVDRVSLLGYSMGGRVCTTIVELLPANIRMVTLIATDGLATNRLYYFCTRTLLGKKIFSNMLKKPGRYFRIIEWLRKTNRLDPTRYKFVMQHLKSADQRQFLLRVWPSMSDLVPDPKKLKQAIKQYHIPVYIFMGTYDRIMPISLAERFKRGLDTVQLFVLEKGHRVFDDKNTRLIADTLL